MTAVDITAIALDLSAKSQTMTAHDLADLLNRKYSRTLYRTNGRGIYTALRCAYARAEASGNTKEASAIAEAFTRRDGRYAYDR